MKIGGERNATYRALVLHKLGDAFSSRSLHGQRRSRALHYWRWKSKAPIGRPPIDKEIRELIRRISRENPLWGVPRIQSELRLLGFNVTDKTVAKYRVKRAKPPSQTWKTFLANHAK